MNRPTCDSLRRSLWTLLGVAVLAAPAAASIQFEKATACIRESARTLEVRLTRTAGETAPAEYYVIAYSNTAVGTFYNGPACGTANNPDFHQPFQNRYLPYPSCANAEEPCTLTVFIDICDDGVAEPDETFFISLAAQSGTTNITGPQDQMTVTIGDSCPAPTGIRLERGSYDVSEGSGTLTVRAVRTGDLTTPQNVTITTVPVTAAKPADYNHAAFFDKPWPPGASSMEFPITIANDSLAEINEKLTVSLSAGSLTVAPSQATVTIVDDDGPAQAPLCGGDATTLALNGDRFHISVDWRDFQGNTGAGNAQKLTSDTGYFWFFDKDNVEIMVKALDARSIGSGFWIFAGALTNVQYTMTVIDTVTGAQQTYDNPSGNFASFGDTAAFGGIVAPSSCPAFIAPAKLPGCDPPPTGTSLCLTQGGRFRVSVDWRDSQGNTGVGRSVTLTRDSGYYWFFTEENIEVVIKVLDARAINGKFWVFYGALSNVEYTIAVTDTVTGTIRFYHNPSGHFGSVGDTSAF